LPILEQRASRFRYAIGLRQDYKVAFLWQGALAGVALGSLHF
jgi:hypothetical protein